jgi:hypothetical protein
MIQAAAFSHREKPPLRYSDGWKFVLLRNDVRNSVLTPLFNLISVLDISILFADLLLLNRAINPIS